MFKVKDLICLILVALSVTISSCSKDEPESPAPDSADNKVVINSDGSASGGAVFSRIDENTFWLDYVKYKIVDSHLEIIGHDRTELPLNPKLYSEVTLNGATLKTRKIDESAFENAKCHTVSIPEGVITISFAAFSNCYSLKSLSIPSSIKYLNYNCFGGCSNVKELKLNTPNSELRYYLDDLSRLSKLTFQNKVTFITDLDYLFRLSSNTGFLREIYFLSETPPSFEWSSDGSSSKWSQFKSNITVYVPKESLKIYKEKYQEVPFKEILPMP